ncbi:MAG: LysM peptidoglycan-binding domain-containing protein [Gammaproteobacteria bacterium]|nr:LysM peptidoglycan-binding domain-containing protein [Gammaproteobacteria bacterium]
MLNLIRLCVVICSLLLTGCQSFIGDQPPAPVKQAGSAAEVSQWINQAIVKLESGQADAAQMLLKKALAAAPNNPTAKRLLGQIEVAAKKRYGSDFFYYQVKQGDTFGKLALRFLGHSLEFYGLAKYNNIANPQNLRAGQRIKIPQTQPSKSHASNFAAVAEKLSQQQPLAALTELKSITLSKLNRANYIDYLYRTLAALDNDLNADNAQSLLTALKQFPTQGDTKVRQRINISRQKCEYTLHMSKAQQQIAKQQWDLAYQEAVAATRLPKAAHQEKYQNIVDELSEELHGQAVILQRSQKLKQAVELWDQVLRINPQHEPAKIYKARAEKLLVQLNQLNN